MLACTLEWNEQFSMLASTTSFSTSAVPLPSTSSKMVSSESIIVTGFGKTLRMGFFQKIEFDAWLITATTLLEKRCYSNTFRGASSMVYIRHPRVYKF